MPRILVVDDETIVRETIQSWLEREGFDVISAPDGHSALEAVGVSAIDLVIIDIFLPGMGGLEVIGALRKRMPSVPIIAISGYMFGEPMPALLDTTEQVGVAHCLHKPFRPRHLLAAVKSCLTVPGEPSASQAAGA
jgi:CheY-like chemotaxis protein